MSIFEARGDFALGVSRVKTIVKAMDPSKADTTRPASRRVSARWSRASLYGIGLSAGVVCAVLAAVTLSAHWASSASPAPQPVFFKIATGSAAGTYFQIGDMIAEVISHPEGSVRCADAPVCGPMGLIAVAQASAGSVRNVRSVDARLVDSALAQADIAQLASQGTGMFAEDGPRDSLRAIARLYPEAVHLVARWDAEIQSVADLAGKRISIDREGSGSNPHARLILEALGLDDADVTLSDLDPDIAAAQIEAGDLDAFFYTAGAPVPVVAELISDGHAVLVPVAGEAVRALVADHDYLVPTVIPDDVYRGQTAVESIAVGALWIVHEAADDDLVFAITRALWTPQNKPLLLAGHPVGGLMDRETATKGVPIPMHPGADRYYRQTSLAYRAHGPDVTDPAAPARETEASGEASQGGAEPVQ